MNILRAPEAAKKAGFSVPTLWRKSKSDPDFPRPVKISENITGWVSEELDAYLQRRVDASRKAAT